MRKKNSVKTCYYCKIIVGKGSSSAFPNFLQLRAFFRCVFCHGQLNLNEFQVKLSKKLIYSLLLFNASSPNLLNNFLQVLLLRIERARAFKLLVIVLFRHYISFFTVISVFTSSLHSYQRTRARIVVHQHCIWVQRHNLLRVIICFVFKLCQEIYSASFLHQLRLSVQYQYQIGQKIVLKGHILTKNRVFSHFVAPVGNLSLLTYQIKITQFLCT